MRIPRYFWGTLWGRKFENNCRSKESPTRNFIYVIVLCSMTTRGKCFIIQLRINQRSVNVENIFSICKWGTYITLYKNKTHFLIRPLWSILLEQWFSVKLFLLILHQESIYIRQSCCGNKEFTDCHGLQSCLFLLFISYGDYSWLWLT